MRFIKRRAGIIHVSLHVDVSLHIDVSLHVDDQTNLNLISKSHDTPVDDFY